MSHFSMFVPTKATVKLANGNTGHTQGIGIILYRFTNFTIIYSVVPVYYFTGHPYNTISLGDLKFYAGFKNVTYVPLEHCDYVESLVCYWRSPYQTKDNLEYLQIEIFKVNLQRTQKYSVQIFFSLSRHNISQLIHQKNFMHLL